jgi:hypothetical protein
MHYLVMVQMVVLEVVLLMEVRLVLETLHRYPHLKEAMVA